MKMARHLTTAELRRVDQRGRHVALRVERPERGEPFIVLRCPEGHEYAWRDERHKGVNYDFLARWWRPEAGGVTVARDSCPECPHA